MSHAGPCGRVTPRWSVPLQPYQTCIDNGATLKEALDAVVSSRARLAAVFDGDDYLGMLSAERISREIVQ